MASIPPRPMQLWELPYGGRPTQEDLKQQSVAATRRRAHRKRPNTGSSTTSRTRTPPTPGPSFSTGSADARSADAPSRGAARSTVDDRLEANASDGHGNDWPIRYNDIAPWYDHVERFIGVSGNKEGLGASYPTASSCPACRWTVAEEFGSCKDQKGIRRLGEPRDDDRALRDSHREAITQRAALLLPLLRQGVYGAAARHALLLHQPLGSTLPAAAATGNLTLRPHSVRRRGALRREEGAESGAFRVIDAQSDEGDRLHRQGRLPVRVHVRFHANSDEFRLQPVSRTVSATTAASWAATSWTTISVSALGGRGRLRRQYYCGRRPNGIYIPRFLNIGNDKRDYLRGFGYQGGAGEAGWDLTAQDSTRARS